MKNVSSDFYSKKQLKKLKAAAQIQYKAKILEMLTDANDQQYGNCGYQTKTRILSYMYEMLTSKKINFSPVYLSAQKLLADFKKQARIPTFAPEATPDSTGIPQEAIAKYGLMPDDDKLTDDTLASIMTEFQGILARLAEQRMEVPYRRKRWVQLGDGAIGDAKDVLRKYGVSRDTEVKFEGKMRTPVEIYEESPFNGMKWQAIEIEGSPTYRLQRQIANRQFSDEAEQGEVKRTKKQRRYLKDLIEVESSGDVAKSSPKKTLVVDDKDMLKLVKGLLKDGIVPEVMVLSDLGKWINKLTGVVEVPKGSEPEYHFGDVVHVMTVVGLAKDPETGRRFVVAANSWGPTAFGKSGIILIPVKDFSRISLELNVPRLKK